MVAEGSHAAVSNADLAAELSLKDSSRRSAYVCGCYRIRNSTH